jgi:hypothetical protein
VESTTKWDAKQALRSLYAPKNRQFELVQVPDLTYLSVDGVGDPDGVDFQRAIRSIYPVAYGVKFLSKRTLGRDYVVPPLEALWWADDPEVFAAGSREAWKWTVLILLPAWITAEDVDTVIDDLKYKKRTPESSVSVRTISEGESFQALNVGPFSAEGPVLSDLHSSLMPQSGKTFAGPHHEIYLSDFRKTAPEKLRTILRQPVRSIEP